MIRYPKTWLDVCGMCYKPMVVIQMVLRHEHIGCQVTYGSFTHKP